MLSILKERGFNGQSRGCGSGRIGTATSSPVLTVGTWNLENLFHPASDAGPDSDAAYGAKRYARGERPDGRSTAFKQRS